MFIRQLSYLLALDKYRQLVGQLSTGGCLEPATLYLKVVETRGDPRHSH